MSWLYRNILLWKNSNLPKHSKLRPILIQFETTHYLVLVHSSIKFDLDNSNFPRITHYNYYILTENTILYSPRIHDPSTICSLSYFLLPILHSSISTTVPGLPICPSSLYKLPIGTKHNSRRNEKRSSIVFHGTIVSVRKDININSTHEGLGPLY